ncbi:MULTISPECIES: protein kinase [Frankia]|uniref:protein kinase n=1 Tax=Frankia TaxID=1854 RepID=UPI0004144E5B|nr:MULTISPECIES: protein kinase [Frankia]KFB04995.1 protein kinase family protein [Frankia sp. Allo2]OAA21663.1 protein kinase family protein [Frankia casuarinae]
MTFTDDSADRPARRVGGVPEVPGVSMRSRLRDAGSGELWSGQFDQSGIECVVRRVRLAPDPVLRSAAVIAARALVDLEHPHLVPVVAVLPTAEGLALITEPVVGGVSLARLLAARGDLDPGEVVTIGLPIAQALAAAHAVGVVHGRLERADILLEPNGRPVLIGLGVAALADAARPDPIPPEAASADVHDLATLLLGAMREATGPDAAAVAVAVATAMIDDPRRRPSALELAASLARSATPLPVRLAGGGEVGGGEVGGGEPGGAARRGPSPTDTLPAIPWVDPPDDPAPPDRAITGATAVNAAELLDSLPPPPRRSTRATTNPRKAARGGGRGSGGKGSATPGAAAPGPRSPRSGGSTGSGQGTQRGPRGHTTASGSPGPARPPGGLGSPGRSTRPTSARRPRRVGARRQRLLFPVTAGLGLLVVVAAVALLLASPEKDDAPGAAGTSVPPTGAASAAGRGPTASPVANQSPEQVWRSVLAELNTARSRAFERADESLLTESDAAGSELHASDIALMRQVVARGAHASALRSDILDLKVRVEEPDRTVLRVTQRLNAYDFLDAGGKVLAHQAAKSPERRDLTLIRTGSGWRVSENVPVTAG